MFTEDVFYLCLIFQVNDYPTLLFYRADDKANPVITSQHSDFGDKISVYIITTLLTKHFFF